MEWRAQSANLTRMTSQYTTSRPRRILQAIQLDRERRDAAVAIAVASVFVAAGMVLIGVGAGLPLALAVVEQRGLVVDHGDLVLARGLAPLWPLLIGAGVVNFTAALAVLDRGPLGKRVAILVAGVTASLAVAAQVALVAGGADESAIGVATGVASAYIVAFAATTIMGRRDA